MEVSVPTTQEGRTMIHVAIILSLMICTSAYAVEDVRKADLTINGVTYSFPVGTKEREMDVYWLKKFADGDTAARDMFLQGEDMKIMYIGDDSARWLKVTKDTMEVI